MKKIIVLLLVFMLFLLLPAAAEAGSLQTSIIPENTQWLLHFDMQKFASTRLCDLLLGENGVGKLDKAKKMFEKFGIDPLKDITGITIFGPGKDKDKVVVSFTGNLNKNHLLFLLGGVKSHKEFKHGKYTIHNWGHSEFGAFANDNLLLITKDESAIKQTLDVIAGKQKNIKKTKLMFYLKDMPKGAFVEAVADDISSIVGEHKPYILKKTGMAFFLALEKNENLNLKLKMATDTPETAKNIEQIVKGFMSLAKLQQEGKDPKWKQAEKLLEALKISVKGNIIDLELSYPSEELVSFLVGRKSGFNFSF